MHNTFNYSLLALLVMAGNTQAFFDIEDDIAVVRAQAINAMNRFGRMVDRAHGVENTQGLNNTFKIDEKNGEVIISLKLDKEADAKTLAESIKDGISVDVTGDKQFISLKVPLTDGSFNFDIERNFVKFVQTQKIAKTEEHIPAYNCTTTSAAYSISPVKLTAATVELNGKEFTITLPKEVPTITHKIPVTISADKSTTKELAAAQPAPIVQQPTEKTAE